MPDLLPRWRDFLKIHPAAELFPRMSKDELRALAADIKKNGLASPIILWSPGYLGDGTKDRPRFVLDGINRLDAMELGGMPVVNKKGEPDKLHGARFETLYEKRKVHTVNIMGRGDTHDHVETATDPYEYVISANIHRRHLTLWQKCNLITTLLKADPSKSDRQIAATVKASPTFVGKVRAGGEASGDVSTVDTRTDTRGRKQPAKKRKPDDTVTVRTLAVPVTRSTVKVASVGYVQDRGDIGPSSGGELERLRARVSELENEKRVLETKVIGLESEVAELRARLPKDDPFDIPLLLRRH